MEGFNFEKDIDSNIYFKTLCSSGLAFVNKQPQQIEQKRSALLDAKQKLVYNNYDSFIKFSAFSKDSINDFHRIEEALLEIDQTLPTFKAKCEDFAQNAKRISNRWADVSAMLSRYPQLIEFLEIPQLLNNCIRTFYYEDAIKVFAVVSKTCTRNKHVSPIFANMLDEIEKSKAMMVNQILKELNGNVQLPMCIKMVDYLRKVDRFSEEELRLNFLLARDVWFQSSLYKNTFNLYSLSYISNLTEVFRINLFDIVTQYRAIFPDIEHSVAHQGGGAEINSKIINSWLMIKIEQYLDILQQNLTSFARHKSALPLEGVVDHCFYFGLSMSKVGAEIRPKLIRIFNEFIQQRCRFLVAEANKNFEHSIPSMFKTYKKVVSDTTEDAIEDFPAIVNYFNESTIIFAEVSKIMPLASITYLVDTLNSSLMQLSRTLKAYIEKHRYGLNQTELAILTRFCHCCQHRLFPAVAQRFRALFSIGDVGKTFGITNTNLSELGMDKFFELDINTAANSMLEIVL